MEPVESDSVRYRLWNKKTIRRSAMFLAIVFVVAGVLNAIPTGSQSFGWPFTSITRPHGLGLFSAAWRIHYYGDEHVVLIADPTGAVIVAIDMYSFGVNWLTGLACVGIPVTLVARSLFASRYKSACRVCGYDLTGNVTGRCSECGATVPRKSDRAERS